MNIFWKVIIGLVVIALVVWGFMLYNQQQHQTSSTFTQPMTNTKAGLLPGQPTPNSGSETPTTGATSPTDTSDAGLNQDMNSLNTQINTVSTNSAGVNQSLSDTPVQQGQ